ncbi:hypothetical protein SAMN05660297_02916 [Natronincola peptidivorans]|uniref:Uncharacterized protein n=1 Tax=Natronincola peptidivorans TaxID=426128 RepID=A0A1I0FS75_9FIRM|nr:hypothetical protein [Natronincola peptidivorans]SET61084.1 hypothetical protein SAMN05660297_02916 [Natronincola peptidivorans]
MKKLRVGIVFVMVIFLLVSSIGYANSGPVFWQGYPASDIMLIDENSSIEVQSEELIFDFSDSDDFSYTIGGRVTATYQMVNPTDEHLSVKMAFPFIGRLDNSLLEEITITADDDILPYELYIGDVVNSYGNSRQEEKEASFDFANIIKTITNEPYEAKSFKENEKGKLYLIEVKPTTDQEINFAVDFSFDFEETKIITYGFNRYERKDHETRIASWCRQPQVLEIFVLGEDIDLSINGYIDGELKKKTDLFTYHISTEEVELRKYLMEYTHNHSLEQKHPMISETQLYNLYAKSLDNHFTRNMGYISEHDLKGQEYYMRVFTLVYTVDFSEKDEKEVSVSYRASGTMDRRQTAKPLYTFDYILNPAKNWSDFKNLGITIMPPKEAPYIVDSNIELVKGDNNLYTASLADLPEEDLSFTFYENEEITLLDMAAGSLYSSFGYLTPLVLGAVVLFLAASGIMGIRTFKRKKRKQ